MFRQEIVRVVEQHVILFLHRPDCVLNFLKRIVDLASLKGSEEMRRRNENACDMSARNTDSMSGLEASSGAVLHPSQLEAHDIEVLHRFPSCRVNDWH